MTGQLTRATIEVDQVTLTTIQQGLSALALNAQAASAAIAVQVAAQIEAAAKAAEQAQP